MPRKTFEMKGLVVEWLGHSGNSLGDENPIECFILNGL